MNGITILNEFEHEIVEYGFYWLGFFVLLGIFTLTGVITGFVGGLASDDIGIGTLCGLIIGLSVGIFGSAAIASNEPISSTSEIRYEVVISEETNFKEFTNEYEIIEQRGEIYVVREK